MIDRRRLLAELARRYQVMQSWPSVARIGLWAVVWSLIVSVLVAPHTPVFGDRSIEPDRPPSAVRYVSPVDRADTAGFLPPSHDPDAFTLAWIGGSEVKLREVSIPGAFSERVSSVDGRPLRIDSYNVIAPRIIDAIRAIDAAGRSGADAIVLSINPAWARTEWSLRGWDALDVSDLGTLWRQRSTWSWAAALTGPDDYAWRLSRAAFPIVETQVRLNDVAADAVDVFDILDDRAGERTGDPAVDIGDPRLPADTGLWLVEHEGPEIMATEDARVAGLMRGVGVSQAEARFFGELLIDVAERTGVPVFLYGPSFSPESLADPDFAAAAGQVEQFWAEIATTVTSPLVELEPRSLSRDYASAGTFINNVHMADPGPFADLLRERLCGFWGALESGWECV